MFTPSELTSYEREVAFAQDQLSCDPETKARYMRLVNNEYGYASYDDSSSSWED